MTQSKQMSRPWLVLAMAALLFPFCPGAAAQSEPADFSVDRPHPRLLLTPRRHRLLQRECQRRTPRWRQFEALIDGGAPLPEPGFAQALYYAASGDKKHGRAAIGWALTDGSDLRQLALVFDWCQDLLSPPEKHSLAEKLAYRLKTAPSGDDFTLVRSRLFAALAIADEDSEAAEPELRRVVERWWRGRIVPALRRGRYVIPRDQVYPLMEILHAIQDNLLVDLRRDDRHYFASLPRYLLLSYYPATYQAAGNDFHVPVILHGDQPDMRIAALARAADLSLVAYDPNALGTQFLQGFSMRDSFQMRGPFGVTYEFLWANPYQPGLGYYNAPLRLHDARDGRLLVRSSWDGDAKWFYLENGVIQVFEDGRIKRLNWSSTLHALMSTPANHENAGAWAPSPERKGYFQGSLTGPIRLGNAVIEPLRRAKRFTVNAAEPTTCYLIGLQPHGHYDIEVDDEEIREDTADAGGTIEMKFPAGRKAGVRLHLRSQP